MKKSSRTLLIIIICLGFLLVLTIINLKDKNKTNNVKKQEEMIISKKVLVNQLSDWCTDIYKNNEYDKCVTQEDGTCFISLDSLEQDYGKDISLFKAKGAECVLSLSGLSFNLGNSDQPFALILGGCKYNNPVNE